MCTIKGGGDDGSGGGSGGCDVGNAAKLGRILFNGSIMSLNVSDMNTSASFQGPVFFLNTIFGTNHDSDDRISG